MNKFDKFTSVSIKQVANGFVVRNEESYLRSQEYITVTFEEAKRTALRLLTETISEDENVFVVDEQKEEVSGGYGLFPYE